MSQNIEAPYIVRSIDDIREDLDVRVPSQTSHAGGYLQTNGVNTSWVVVNPEEAKEYVTTIAESSLEDTEYTLPSGVTYVKGLKQLIIFLGGVNVQPSLYEEDSSKEDGEACSKITLKTPVEAGQGLYVRIEPKSYMASHTQELENYVGSITVLSQAYLELLDESIFQNDIPLWLATQNYAVGAWVRDDSYRIYRAKIATGPSTSVGFKNPALSGNQAYWRKIAQGDLESLETTAKDDVVSAINEVNYRVNNVYLRTSPSVVTMEWSDVQGYTRAGTASQNLTLGDLVQIPYNGQTINFRLIGFDYDVPYDSNYTHTTTFQCINPNWSVQADAAEADYYTTESMPAGTYTFKYSNVDYQFTTTTTLPSGGQLKFPNGRSASSFTTYGVDLYYSPSVTTVLEHCAITTGNSGTSLGTITEGITSQWNYGGRCSYGSNNYSASHIRQWINSAQESGYWVPQSPFDRPPTQSIPWKYYLDSGLTSCIGSVKKRTALTCSSTSYEDSVENIFLLSRSEVFNETEGSVWETPVMDSGESRALAYPYYQIYNTNADRILKNSSGSAQYWWLRSPYSGYVFCFRFVSTSGALLLDYAVNSYSASPAFAIV